MEIIRNSIKYQLDTDNKTAKVISYQDNPVEVIIPEFIRYRFRKYKVTSICNYALCDCWRLTSLTIPDSVTSIGEGVFYNCSSLTSITIPNSVIYIGDSAFKGCNSLEFINIPNSVTKIGYMTFCACKSLTSIDIPNSVTSIGYKSFAHCSSLSSITIPNNVTKIESWAFYGCDSLTSITIGNSVTEIGDRAFFQCSGLTSIDIPNSVNYIGINAFDNIGLTLPKRYTEDGRLIAYKAFNCDMTCRDFQYEEGKSYEKGGKIKCCEKGFHACTNPLDIFNYYWGAIGNKPYINVMYIPEDILIHEVYLSGTIDEDNKYDSKVCASKIEIGRRLSIKDINNIINYK